MSRARDITRIPTVRDASARTLESIADVLRSVVGRASSLVCVPLVGSTRTTVASSAPGTRIVGSGTACEIADALLQQWRLICEAEATPGATVELVDVSAGVVLARVALTTAGVHRGEWETTPIAAPIDHVLEARAVGTGVCTIHALTAQARTVSAPAR
jgi:hypothetical protein